MTSTFMFFKRSKFLGSGFENNLRTYKEIANFCGLAWTVNHLLIREMANGC